MKAKNDRTQQPDVAGTPQRRRRFRIDRLEERIAPKRGGKGTKNCPTDTCGDFCGGTSSY